MNKITSLFPLWGWFIFWILAGFVMFFVAPIVRNSFCPPEQPIAWHVEGHTYSAPKKNEPQRHDFTGQEKKAAEGDAHPQPSGKYFCKDFRITDWALVFFTYCLALVGGFTLRSADQNTKRAERAYLVAGPLFGVPKQMHPSGSLDEWLMQKRALKSMFGGPWRMAILNFGKTAAYSTKMEWGFCPRDQFPEKIRVSKLMTGCEYAQWRCKYIAEKSPIEIQDVFSPNPDNPLHYRHIEITDEERIKYLRWVFFGRITYKDVFREEHFSTFSYHLIEEHANSIGKSLSDDHN